MTYINNLDALAAAAVLIMGEGNECIPMAMITNAPRIEFLSTPSTDVDMQEITISLDEDFYAPVLRAVDWTWNRK